MISSALKRTARNLRAPLTPVARSFAGPRRLSLVPCGCVASAAAASAAACCAARVRSGACSQVYVHAPPVLECVFVKWLQFPRVISPQRRRSMTSVPPGSSTVATCPVLPLHVTAQKKPFSDSRSNSSSSAGGVQSGKSASLLSGIFAAPSGLRTSSAAACASASRAAARRVSGIQ